MIKALQVSLCLLYECDVDLTLDAVINVVVISCWFTYYTLNQLLLILLSWLLPPSLCFSSFPLTFLSLPVRRELGARCR